MAVKLSNGLMFSEILADNAGGGAFDTNGDGKKNKADEFVEIQSTQGSGVSLDGIEIWSADRGLLYSFSSTDQLAPNGTATVVGLYTNPRPAGFFSAGLPNNNTNSGLLPDGEGNKKDTLFLVDRNTGEYVTFSYGEPPELKSPPSGFPGTNNLGGEEVNSGAPNATSFTRNGEGVFEEDKIPEPGEREVPCFARGTRIRTTTGDRAVEDLRVGDMIPTLDHGDQPIRWIGTAQIGAAQMAQDSRLRPVRLRAGCLGPGLPAHDITVSQQHRILLANPVIARMFGEAQVLAAATHLVGQVEGAQLDHPAEGTTYYHIMFDRHEVIFAEGAPTESFYFGDRSDEVLTKAQRAEIALIFPELLQGAAPRAARVLAPGRRARRAVQRSAKNRKPLCADTQAERAA